MLTLYHDRNAVCCQKVELALSEKGVDYDGRTVSLFRSEQYDPAYLKINPRGVVPTLVHDGATIIESTVICEYLDEAFPDPPLMPDDRAERAQVRQWTKLVDEEIHDAGSTLSFCAMFRDRMIAMDEAEREKRFRNVGNPVREHLYRSAVDQGVASPFAFRAIASYELMARDLEKRLARTGEWIAGGRYSLAETAITPYFARAEYLGLLDLWTGDRPAVSAWWQRIKKRPSYGAVIADTLTESDLDEMLRSGEKIRSEVAAVRAAYLHANEAQLV
jgi:glutathione S-transferase